jgi:hypothetical protein
MTSQRSTVAQAPLVQATETTVDALHLALVPGQPRCLLRVENLSDQEITQLKFMLTGSSLLVSPTQLFIPRISAGAQGTSEITLSFTARAHEAQLRFTAVYRVTGENRPKQTSGVLQLVLIIPEQPSIAAPKPIEQINLATLRQMIITYFNDSELRDLCFDLQIDYESLEGQGKASKARELIAYVVRYRRTAELIAVCRRLRPEADWQG